VVQVAGRPSLGEQARTLRQSTKISAAEKRWLEEEYGTAHTGLRVALDTLKAQRGDAPKIRRAPKVVKATPVARPVVPVQADGTPVRCRIHRSWVTLDEYYAQGIKMREKRCEACGFVVEERAS
jgi:hypothetical protein